MTIRFLGLLCAALPLASGCLNWGDDIEFACTTPATSGPALSGPMAYGLGASLVVPRLRRNADGNVVETLTLESTDETVLEVAAVAEADEVSRARAIGPGTAEIIVRRSDGSEHGRATIVVAAPTRYALYSRLELLAGHTDEDAYVARPRIVTGASADFFVRAFADDDELIIAGGVVSLDLSSPGSLVLPSGYAPSASITTTTEGDHDALVSFSSGFFSDPPDITVSLPVRGVGVGSVQSIAFTALADDEALDGDCRAAVTYATDVDGEVVEGASATFTDPSGATLYGEGIVLNYRQRDGASLPVRATVGTMSVDLVIESDGESLDAGGTTGCSVGGRSDVATWAVCLAAVLVLSRRVRRRPTAR